ncbi:NADPH azoreductase [Daphnia magna]|uniref:NADPH azoreductase n=1 Tax=Daphnia magna TaxID=35525 RepID=UPI0006E78322|nr:NADPH azoreductase [Daphnia magna]
MPAKKIIVFLGSTRDGRLGDKVANYVRNVLEQTGMSAKIFDPLEMDFQMLRQPLHFMKDKSAAPSWVTEANKEIESADGFVVVLSEYNCGVPPALSNMMNHFPPASYRHRPCSIVTYSMGDFGGIRAATVVQPFLSELGMISLPVRVALPAVHKKFDEGGQPNDARFQDNVLRLVNELSWYVDALCNKKNMSQDIPK